MASGSQMYDNMGRVRALLSDKLDGLGSAMPPVKQRVPFEQYLAKAETRAIADPAFREQYEAAKRQYTALGGKING
jgi:hypothetical protein